ncbi:glutamyl aminopeptidase [Caerostris extrusa]|uniref:Glutamyl aminopeptidase n=1 Tax=Caerostris extrusa TaxID=172846 RepID=A0AAV4RBR3_CAEEX|nr:glutamyl aminopeptidase [Caerostris extrusa]
MKATFQLTVVHEEYFSAYFNSEMLHTSPYGNGLSITVFDKTLKMSTYLVAFVVCDFKALEKMSKSSCSSEQLNQAQYALDTAVNVLHFFQQFFNISYPLPKLDMIAIPDFGPGAMENWGLVTYRMTTVLYNPRETSSESKEHVATVIAHELAHQWFGNLVTMQWWSDLWLNEGFASFVEYLGTNHVEPGWRMMDQFIVSTSQDAMSLDGLESSHPVMTDVDNPEEIDAIFDFISYKKSISNNITLKCVQNFRHMDSPKGYPLLTVTLKHRIVRIKQQRFLLTPPEYDDAKPSDLSPYGYKWFVPVTYITDGDPVTHTFWLNMTDGEFLFPARAKWLKLNVNQTGFYRVMYDNGLWNTLINLLHTNHNVFKPADRANLLDDALTLARVGILDSGLAFNLTRYLEKKMTMFHGKLLYCILKS